MSRRNTGPGRVTILRDLRSTARALLWNFDFEWHELKQAHTEWIWGDPADILSWGGVNHVVIRGFASRIGRLDFNLRLGRRRAEEVTNELRRAIVGSQPSIRLESCGEDLSLHRYRGRRGDDEDIHRSVDVIIFRNVPPPMGRIPILDFGDDFVSGTIRPAESFDSFRRAVNRHEPQVPDMPVRTNVDHSMTVATSIRGFVEALLGSGGTPGLGTGAQQIWQSNQALVHGAEQTRSVAAYFGYADTIARIAASMPRAPQGRRPSLPSPIITDVVRQRFVSSRLSLEGYERGYRQVNDLIADMDQIRAPGRYPSEAMLCGLKSRYAAQASGEEARRAILRGLLQDVMRSDYDELVRESLRMRATP